MSGSTTDRAKGMAGPRSLTVFHDPGCGLCRSFREWLQRQPLWVPVRFVGFDTPEAERLFPGIRSLEAGKDCVVQGDDGQWWQGADAWLVCLWATREHRLWSFRLASPMLRPVVRSVVRGISENRLKLSRMLRLYSERELAEIWQDEAAGCGDGSCRRPVGEEVAR